MSKILKLVLSVLVIFITKNASSQSQGNSAYSILGVGDVLDESVAAQDMMGGTGVTFANTFYVNNINPALLVKNRTIGGNKYVAFNFGFKGAYKTITQDNNTNKDFGLNLSNLTMAFPVKPWWAMSVSIKPYSSADYVGKTRKQFTGSNFFNVNEYKNAGGVSRVAFTNSFQLAKGLYFGVETQYNFGNIQKDTSTYIENKSSIEIFRYGSRFSYKGASLKTGVAYQQKLNKKWQLNYGAVYQLGSNLKGEQLRIFSVLREDLGSGGVGAYYIQKPDTLSLTNINTDLPSKYKLGISLESNYHWIFAVDYGVTNWVNAKQLDKQAQAIFRNSTELNMGIEWLPNSNSSKYLDQVFYRVGFKQVSSPYVFNNVAVKDKSLSLGLSFPMGFRNPSYIDLGVSVGQRGSDAPGIVKENYTKISFGFSLLSSWFNKPRID
jgi:hypothetical protein